MPAETKTTQPSKPEEVDAYMKNLKHPLADLAEQIRRTILAADSTIGEEIKWNAPAFFYTGPMKPFNPKDYSRHLIVFNFHRKDSIRLVFWHGDRANDKSGFLEGDYPDGRRLAIISNEEELESRKNVLVKAIKAQLKHLK
jgi:hypothetical protein